MMNHQAQYLKLTQVSLLNLQPIGFIRRRNYCPLST